MTIWRVLKKHHVKPVVKRRKKSDYKPYNKDIPGDRVQLDVTKLAPKAYQFTAIDDCTRMKVIRVYPNKKAENTIHFLGEIMDTFQFPIQHIQTDWGTEFFNYDLENPTSICIVTIDIGQFKSISCCARSRDLLWLDEYYFHPATFVLSPNSPTLSAIFCNSSTGTFSSCLAGVSRSMV